MDEMLIRVSKELIFCIFFYIQWKSVQFVQVARLLPVELLLGAKSVPTFEHTALVFELDLLDLNLVALKTLPGFWFLEFLFRFALLDGLAVVGRQMGQRLAGVIIGRNVFLDLFLGCWILSYLIVLLLLLSFLTITVHHCAEGKMVPHVFIFLLFLELGSFLSF